MEGDLLISLTTGYLYSIINSAARSILLSVNHHIFLYLIKGILLTTSTEKVLQSMLVGLLTTGKE